MTCEGRFGEWARVLDDAGWTWYGTGGGVDFPSLYPSGKEDYRIALLSGVGNMMGEYPESTTERVALTIYLDEDWQSWVTAEFENVIELIKKVGDKVNSEQGLIVILSTDHTFEKIEDGRIAGKGTE